jgi:branched-chain amino acid transport system ATP-binding protein
MMPLLRLDDLTVAYAGAIALRGCSLTVHSDEVVCLLGANGAGKTTTLRAVTGLVKPQKGRVLLDGRDVIGLPAEQMVRFGVAMVPEGRQVFPDMTVEENLDLGGRVLRSRSKHAELLDMVFKLFPRLSERQRQRAGTLSGGEQQMLAIGRALMSAPRFIMFDEPSLGLAPMVVERVFETIPKIRAQGVTILLVEQNAEQALAVADRGYVLEAGSVVLQGSSDELRRSDHLRRAFLGK